MVDKRFFSKYQRQLLWLINTRFGQWYFRISKDIPKDKTIIEIQPSSFTWVESYVKKDGEWYVTKTTDFRTHAKFAKRLNTLFTWLPFNAYKPTWLNGEWFLQPKLGLTVSTFYPVAGANSPVDGVAYKQVSSPGVDWTDLVNGNGNVSADTNATDYLVYFFSSDTTDKWRNLFRGFFTFDTSTISADDIDSATISFYGTAKTDGSSSTPDVNIYQATMTSTSSLSNSDFENAGSVAFSSVVTYSNWSISGYNDFVLNAPGRSNINKTGVSEFSSRNANYDVADTNPTWGSFKTSYLEAYFADQAGTTNDPKLVVTHTASGSTYTLTAGLGTFTLTGIAAGLTKTWNDLVASVGTFTLTGISTGLAKGYNIVASVGTFTLTGINTILTKTYTLTASLGAFTLTGIDTILTRTRKLAASTGSFILTGIDVVFKYAGFTNISKNSATLINISKNTATLTNTSKNTATLTNTTKNTATLTNASKNSATLTNISKS